MLGAPFAGSAASTATPDGHHTSRQSRFRIWRESEANGLQAVVGHSMANFNGSLLVWGGYRQDEDQDIEYRSPSCLYILPAALDADLHNATWIEYRISSGDIPPKTSGACAVLLETTLVLFGGYTKDDSSSFVMGHTNELYMLDLRRELWTRSRCTTPGELLPTPRDKTTGWSFRDKCYFFGGYGPPATGFLNTVEHDNYLYRRGDSFVTDDVDRFYWNNQLVVYDPSAVDCKFSLASVGGIVPCARAAASSCRLGGRDDCVLLFGGRHMGTRMNDLYVIDMNSLVFTPVEIQSPEHPVGRSWCTLTACGPRSAILYGGLSNVDNVLNDCWLVCIAMDGNGGVTGGTWTRLFSTGNRCLAPRHWHTAAISEGRLLVCGGSMVGLRNATSPSKVVRLAVEPSSLTSIAFARVTNAARASASQVVDCLPMEISIAVDFKEFLKNPVWTHPFWNLSLCEILSLVSLR